MNIMNDLKVIYGGTVMKARRAHQVYIEKKHLHCLSNTERKNLVDEPSWKGQVYIVQVGEKITFVRSNNWDLSYFKLESGTTFIEGCGNPLSYFDADKFELVKLKGNKYDGLYNEFIEKYPEFKED